MGYSITGVTTVLSNAPVVPQNEIIWDTGTPQTVLMTTYFTLPSTQRVLISTTFRWYANDNSSTFGARVAFIRIDGVDVGTLLIVDSQPGNLMQFSTSGYFSTVLQPGPHTAAVHFGGCCGNYGHPFVVGSGSRLDVTW